MSNISILYRLQQIDSQLDNYRAALEKIGSKLSNTSALQAAQQLLAEADVAYSNETRQLREIEHKVHDIRIKTEQSEASLYGGKIHNPKELQDLQNEIASLNRAIASLEDRELEEMMVVEQAEAELNLKKKSLSEAESEQIEHNAVLSGEKSKILGQIERLESERKAALQPITPDELTLYEQLRKTRKGIAVAKVTSRACGACGTTLTAALIQNTQSPGQMVRCPTCSRILYPG